MTARIKGATDQKNPVAKSPATEMTVKVRRALWLVLAMLSLSLLLVVLGIYTTSRTDSLSVSGYTSGIILTLGSFLGLVGLRLKENRKQLLTAAIVFLSFGIITSFLCVVIDGVCIVLNLDMRPLRAGRCQYYSSGSSYVYENYYTSVQCWNLKETCSMTVRSGTCYCCDLYDCANGDYLSNYYEFVGVRSCEEVFTLYILIWTLTGLNLVALFTGILTTAVLGSIKDLSSNQLPKTSEKAAPFPTAPLLMDSNSHRIHQLHPEASVYFPSVEGTAASQSLPSSSTPHSESHPPAFAPLPYRIHSTSA